MRIERMLHNSAWCLSLLLGQASALMGFMITLGWTLAIAVIVPPKGIHAVSGPQALLPIGWPLIGLSIAILGLIVARWSDEPVSRFSVAGVILNALPLMLSILVSAL